MTEPAMLEKLQEVISSEQIITGELRSACQVDGKQPLAVVRPQSVDEVAGLLGLAGQQGWGVIPWGSGTQMGIGNIPHHYELAIDLSALDEVVEYDADNLTLTAGAGCTLKTLEELAGQNHQIIPFDPPLAHQATLGGVIAANAFGPSRFAYGGARDLALGVQVALSTGERIEVGGKTVKNVAGYDLTKLFVGSFGTLGIITRITCRTLPAPAQVHWTLAAFPGLSQAASFVAAVLNSVLLPTSLDMAEGRLMPNRSDQEMWVIARVQGSAAGVKRQMEDLSVLATGHGAQYIDLLGAFDEEGQHILRLVRDLPATARQPLILRAHLPISAVPRLWSAARQLEGEEQAVVNLLARAGLGVLYLMIDSDEHNLLPIAQNIQLLAQELDGHAVVERIPTALKADIDVWGPPRPEWKIMAELKRHFDPASILCPGRFVDHL